MRLYVKMIYVATALLYTGLTKLSVGVPVRTLLSSFLFVLLFFAYRRHFVDTLRTHALTVGVFVALTAVGGFLTLLNGRGVGATVIHGLSDTIQPFLILVSTGVLIRLAGVQFVASVLVGTALLTGTVALLQFVDVGAAWQIRDILGEIQSAPVALELAVEEQGRAMGVSLTPIVLSYHIASAYILVSVLYRLGRMPGPVYVVLVLSLLAMSAASGTRSLVFGIFVHEVLFGLARLRLRSVLWVGGLAAIGLAGYLYLGTIGSRVASLDDASAVGRLVLFNFGLRLSGDHLLGLGWGFVPGDFAWLYWEHLSGFVNSDGVFRLGIHNAFLNFFLTYGVFGVAVIAVAAYLKPRKFIVLMASCTAYVIHSTFHNGGLFVGDYYAVFALAVLIHLYRPLDEPRRMAAEAGLRAAYR